MAGHAAGLATAPAWSLSHSDGHALVAHGPAGWRMGVDLERKRVRDLEALAPWCCDDAEQAHLQALAEADRLTFFYQLWTLKESFIKAAGLDFPADMRTVGLRAQADGWALRAPAGTWDARCWTIGEDWVASVVWSMPDGGQATLAGPAEALHWRAARNCVLPPVRTVYAASSTWPYGSTAQDAADRH
ncbi:4-diphosphocytidyl-2C-methyl-D-erythritol kinase [Achromobacter sp. HZ34]|nr:4-diphosphocytidyl-2C-methyl-D-erythritol kinase [Achromobacter sp. HZ34]